MSQSVSACINLHAIDSFGGFRLGQAFQVANNRCISPLTTKYAMMAQEDWRSVICQRGKLVSLLKQSGHAE